MKLEDSTPPRTRPTHYPIRSFYVALTLAELDEVLAALDAKLDANEGLLERLNNVQLAEKAKA